MTNDYTDDTPQSSTDDKGRDLSADGSLPLPREVVEAFQGIAPADVVERGPADPDQLRALHSIPPMSPVTLRMTEVTEHGIREYEVEGLYGGNYAADN